MNGTRHRDSWRRRVRTIPAYAGLALLVGSLGPPYQAAQGGRCLPSSNVPLPDLNQAYRGLRPGLYPDGQPTPSASDAVAAAAQARRIQPLDAGGRPSEAGQIVLLAIGMSNTASEFGRFAQEVKTTPGVNGRLALVNGALSNADGDMWARPKGMVWQHLRRALGRYTPAQVQAVWIKQAHLGTVPFPEEIAHLTGNLEAIVRTARSLFSNLRLVYVSSRTRSGATTRRGPGEPQAYETAFAVRRLLEDERVRPDDGTWVTWGPYLWANATPRSDGLVWDCDDLQPDLLHPSESGDLKVAQQLMTFFVTNSTAYPWFLDERSHRDGSAPTINASTLSGRPPLDVEFRTAVTWADRFYWSFGDGTSASSPQARKTFYREGTYDVGLTVIDTSGRWARAAIQVRVGR